MIFEDLPEFLRDLKTLSKRYRTLEEDLEVVKQVLEHFPDERPPFSYRLSDYGISSCVIKIKKMACRALKGRGANSGLRLIYAHYADEQKIVLIELYHKSDKDLEDRDRILRNFE